MDVFSTEAEDGSSQFVWNLIMMTSTCWNWGVFRNSRRCSDNPNWFRGKFGSTNDASHLFDRIQIRELWGLTISDGYIFCDWSGVVVLHDLVIHLNLGLAISQISSKDWSARSRYLSRLRLVMFPRTRWDFYLIILCSWSNIRHSLCFTSVETKLFIEVYLHSKFYHCDLLQVLAWMHSLQNGFNQIECQPEGNPRICVYPIWVPLVYCM
jgi:hypothetical protein